LFLAFKYSMQHRSSELPLTAEPFLTDVPIPSPTNPLLPNPEPASKWQTVSKLPSYPKLAEQKFSARSNATLTPVLDCIVCKLDCKAIA
jgi:hypothetical protein